MKTNHPEQVRRSRAQHLAGLMVAAIGGLLAPVASGDTIVSPGFPVVNDTVGNFAVKINYTTTNIAASTVSGDSESQTFYPLEDENIEIPKTEWSALTPMGIYTDGAISHLSARASEGTIGGYVDVTVEDGAASASVDVVIEYMDLITTTHAGVPRISPALHGQANRATTPGIPSEFANTSATLDAYVFAGNPSLPPAGTAFSPVYHGKISISPSGETDSLPVNTTFFPADSKWWYVMRLEITGSASLPFSTAFLSDPGVTLTASGDFSNTALMTLDADPSTPDFAYTSYSGISYTSASLLPEPASIGLLLFPAASLFHRRVRVGKSAT